MSDWESTRTPSLRKSASCSIIALRNNSESPILSSSATVHSPSVDWSLLKEPHGGRLRQQPLPFTHSRGHYLRLHRIAIPVVSEWCQARPCLSERRYVRLLKLSSHISGCRDIHPKVWAYCVTSAFLFRALKDSGYRVSQFSVWSAIHGE